MHSLRTGKPPLVGADMLGTDRRAMAVVRFEIADEASNVHSLVRAGRRCRKLVDGVRRRQRWHGQSDNKRVMRRVSEIDGVPQRRRCWLRMRDQCRVRVHAQCHTGSDNA